MLLADDVAALRAWRGTAPGPVGLVPTMGALHAGHLSLVEAARSRCAGVVVSVFVNPLQFGPGEDFDRYPRDLEGDLAQLRTIGVDAVFAPDAAAFTDGLATTVSVSGVTGPLEGLSRPGHFDGVTTIVAKLLHTVAPDAAFFGEKDFQQLAVVRRMVTDLNFGIDIVGCPIVRDPDGLALSSRNAALSPDERRVALRLSRALHAAASAWDGDADAARAVMHDVLVPTEAGGPDGAIEIDYAEVADPATLRPLTGAGHGEARGLVAARVGRTRLIDNLALHLDRSTGGGR